MEVFVVNVHAPIPVKPVVSRISSYAQVTLAEKLAESLSSCTRSNKNVKELKLSKH